MARLSPSRIATCAAISVCLVALARWEGVQPVVAHATGVDEPPVITLNPYAGWATSGQVVYMSSSASGSPAPTAQWQISYDYGATYRDLFGATSVNYSFTASAAYNGRKFRVVYTNAAGTAITAPANLIVRRAGTPRLPNDLDNDGVPDLIVWRAPTGTWRWVVSSTGYWPGNQGQKQWGSQSEGDVPLLGDVDGDGFGDFMVWRASTGTWYWLTSSTGYNYANARAKQWGNQTLGDVPIVADIDGDGQSDLIVWRASTGTWYWLTSSSGYNYAAARGKQWGSQAAGDKPMVGDIDGDGMVDLMLWRASTGTWHWLTSSSGYDDAAAGQKQWGNQAAGDVPLVADMDGDRRSDLVVWRAPLGVWYWLTSADGYDYAKGSADVPFSTPLPGDIPFLLDFDGDGHAELGLWRPDRDGTTYWLNRTLHTYDSRLWGSPSDGDVPIWR